MTFLAHPTHYTRDEFRAMVAGVEMKGWRPAFPTLHNTGVPSLAQWLAMGVTPQERWGASLDSYYKNQLGWHSGPHFVVCRDYIWQLCDLAADGVSVSCWNHATVGVEMVGNYEVGGDDFATGHGAKVRDNAAFALAVLSEKFGWSLSDYVEGRSGLHFHRECRRDGHPCPGSKVSKPDMIQRAADVMKGFGPLPPRPRPVAPPSAPVPVAHVAPIALASVEDIQGALNRLGARPPLSVDGDCGTATKAAVNAFQASHGCAVDGWVGPQTIAAIKGALLT